MAFGAFGARSNGLRWGVEKAEAVSAGSDSDQSGADINTSAGGQQPNRNHGRAHGRACLPECSKPSTLTLAVVLPAAKETAACRRLSLARCPTALRCRTHVAEKPLSQAPRRFFPTKTHPHNAHLPILITRETLLQGWKIAPDPHVMAPMWMSRCSMCRAARSITHMPTICTRLRP